ncbi:hypothetical protein A2U01_0058936, partial [Trifolium medium]|nr:hypothetical protein [Trifolium medium]
MVHTNQGKYDFNSSANVKFLMYDVLMYDALMNDVL